jgi:hypothetical protein
MCGDPRYRVATCSLTKALGVTLGICPLGRQLDFGLWMPAFSQCADWHFICCTADSDKRYEWLAQPIYSGFVEHAKDLPCPFDIWASAIQHALCRIADPRSQLLHLCGVYGHIHALPNSSDVSYGSKAAIVRVPVSGLDGDDVEDM